MFGARDRASNGMTTGMEFGERLAFARKRAGLSQSELARRVGLRSTAVSAIESGVTKASGKVASIARTLDCDPFWLETGDGDQEAAYPRFDASIIRSAVLAALDAAKQRPGVVDPALFADVVARLCGEFHGVSAHDNKLLRAFAAGAIGDKA